MIFSLIMSYQLDAFSDFYIKLDLRVGDERNLSVHCLKMLPGISNGQLLYRISVFDSEITFWNLTDVELHLNLSF